VTPLGQDETVEDLQCEGLKIITRRGGFRYGTDSVLLANYVRAKRRERIVELCSGAGVISILLSAKTRASRIDGIEIQNDLVEMANRSAAMNNIAGRVGFLCGDIRDIRMYMKAGSAEVVAVNPPYAKPGTGTVNPEKSAAVARHEILCDLSDVTAAARWLLNPGGSLYMVYKPDRLVDLFYAMRESGIEPKEILPVCPVADKPVSLVMVYGKKGAAAGLRYLSQKRDL
jgi:tRNA1(Val) A37 N6-methylase TrmN6